MLSSGKNAGERHKQASTCPLRPFPKSRSLQVSKIARLRHALALANYIAM